MENDCVANEVEVAVLKEKLVNVEKIFNRLDDAITKIVEVNNNVSKMLAVHDERLSKQERTDEILFDKIDRLHQQMDKDHGSVLQRISDLERKVWTGLGALGVLTLVIRLVTPGIVTNMLSTVSESDRMLEVLPASVELHRHQVHPSSIR